MIFPPSIQPLLHPNPMPLTIPHIANYFVNCQLHHSVSTKQKWEEKNRLRNTELIRLIYEMSALTHSESPRLLTTTAIFSWLEMIWGFLAKLKLDPIDPLYDPWSDLGFFIMPFNGKMSGLWDTSWILVWLSTAKKNTNMNQWGHLQTEDRTWYFVKKQIINCTEETHRNWCKILYKSVRLLQTDGQTDRWTDRTMVAQAIQPLWTQNIQEFHTRIERYICQWLTWATSTTSGWTIRTFIWG